MKNKKIQHIFTIKKKVYAKPKIKLLGSVLKVTKGGGDFNLNEDDYGRFAHS